MYCKKCGSELVIGAKFCAKCGESLIDFQFSNTATKKESGFKVLKWAIAVALGVIAVIGLAAIWVSVDQPNIEISTEWKSQYSLFGEYKQEILKILSKENKKINITKIELNGQWVAVKTITANTIYSSDPGISNSDIDALQAKENGMTVGQYFDALSGNQSFDKIISVPRKNLKSLLDSLIGGGNVYSIDSVETDCIKEPKYGNYETLALNGNNSLPAIPRNQHYTRLTTRIRMILTASLNAGESIELKKDAFCKDVDTKMSKQFPPKDADVCSFQAEIVNVKVVTTSGTREGEMHPKGIDVHVQ